MTRLLAAVCALFLLPLIAVGAEPRSIDEGIEYRLIEPPLPVDVPAGKVLVTEQFWYGCPHCYHFEPKLQEWLKKQGDRVVFERRPSTLNPGWGVHAKAYYTAEILGVLDKIHEPLFDAIHKEHRKLNTEDDLAKFFTEHGVDEAEFRKVFNSFFVRTKLARDKALTENCCASGVPNIIINGKYFTDASYGGGLDGLLQVMDHLVDKELAGK